MSTGSRAAALEQRRKEREEKRQAQRESKREDYALRDAFSGPSEEEPDIVRELITDEDLSVGEVDDLQGRTVAKINNMLGRDWVLANLTDAQEHDVRFKLEVLKMKVLGMHPPENGIEGKARAFLLDDKEEEIHPLTQQERVLIDELFEALKARMTRGRGGFERKQMNTSISRAETGSESSDEESGGLRSLFS